MSIVCIAEANLKKSQQLLNSPSQIYPTRHSPQTPVFRRVQVLALPLRSGSVPALKPHVRACICAAAGIVAHDKRGRSMEQMLINHLGFADIIAPDKSNEL